MKLKINILFILILGINISVAQSESEKTIIGKWILIEETDSFPDDIKLLTENNSELKTNSKAKSKTTLTFNIDKSIFINQNENVYNSYYKLTDSILSIGNRNYILLKVDNSKLIYKNKDGLFNKHYKYKKIE